MLCARCRSILATKGQHQVYLCTVARVLTTSSLTLQDYPASQPLGGDAPDPEGIMIAGGSMIVGPLGEVLAGPLRGQEG
jgi:hypothetical protein